MPWPARCFSLAKSVRGQYNTDSTSRAARGLAFGPPRELFPLEPQETNLHYSPAPDGQRFLAIEPIGGQAADPITVVVNWTASRQE